MDARTGILLDSMELPVTCRIEARAKILAIEEAKEKTVMSWALNRYRTLYGITEAQFTGMVADGAIDPLRGFVYKITNIVKAE